MIALSPRQIGQSINIDNIQFFLDYCNSTILSGQFNGTGFLPSLKLISLSMKVELVDPNDESKTQLKTIVLTEDEKAFIERVYKVEGWFTAFTNRQALSHIHDTTSDPATQDLMHKVLTKFAYNYNEDIFVLSTYAFADKNTFKTDYIASLSVTEPNPS